MRKFSVMISATMVAMALAATANAAEPAPPAATTAAPADDKMETVCRKHLETGSLVKARKTCHTRAQWAYLDDETRRMANRFVEDNRGRTAGSN
jgi:hypothetical protein